jgi:hypothetical protein
MSLKGRVTFTNLAIPLKMFSDSNSLFNQVIQIFWERSGKTYETMTQITASVTEC